MALWLYNVVSCCIMLYNVVYPLTGTALPRKRQVCMALTKQFRANKNNKSWFILIFASQTGHCTEYLGGFFDVWGGPFAGKILQIQWPKSWLCSEIREEFAEHKRYLFIYVYIILCYIMLYYIILYYTIYKYTYIIYLCYILCILCILYIERQRLCLGHSAWNGFVQVHFQPNLSLSRIFDV